VGPSHYLAYYCEVLCRSSSKIWARDSTLQRATRSDLVVSNVRQHRTIEADEMLTNLSELLRQTLDGWDTQEVQLRREVELINLYLDIRRVRFQDRLTIEISLSPATLNALVPSLLLQPLVENAVRHGVSKSSSPVKIELKSSVRDSRLEIQVCDDGPRSFRRKLWGRGGIEQHASPS
jgi:LytS/YehU family sensor histidine kinase